VFLMVVQGRRWSAIVKAWEPFLAASLVGRLELHATHYRGAHDEEGRAWVTLDGEQIVSVESLPYLMRVYGHSSELKAIGEDAQGAWDAAIEVAHREGLVYLWDFEAAVASYPGHAIDDALASPDVVVRALAMVDRRLGRRRLATLQLRTDESPIVRRMLEVRRAAEGLGAVGAPR
jgi:hypothetical protein